MTDFCTIYRYVMIAHHNVYNRIYKKFWIGAMIAFCWVISFGMQIPTLLGVWGKSQHKDACACVGNV
jgi:hypothetical protein